MRLAVLVVLAACAPKPVSTSVADPMSVAPAPVATATPSEILMTSAGDLDGEPGDEPVTLMRDGTLRAGEATLRIALDEANSVFDRQRVLAVVPLGHGRRGLLVGLPTDEPEDPPNRYRVFVYDDGELRLVLDRVIGVYGETPLDFTEDGAAHYTESGWMACLRVSDDGRKPVAHAMKEIVTLQLDRAGKRMDVTSRRPTGEMQACDQLAG